MSNPALSIAHISSPQTMDTGDFIYRVRQPDAAIAAVAPGTQTISFTMVNPARDRLVRDADVLVIQMVGDPDLLPVILDRRRRRRLTVFEVSDNFFAFQPSNPSAAFYNDPANRACLLQLLSLSDAMQTTMPELERRFSEFNPRCGVFMNQMASLGDPSRPDGPVTVGWGGSTGHLEDMRRAAPALIEWLRRRPEVHLAIMADEKIIDLFRDAPPDRLRIAQTGSLDRYFAFLQTLHIGLAPLLEEDFNLCRSDVKFMEYASRGVVPVCSRVPTYTRTLRHGETGFLFSNNGEMIEILDRLVDDAPLRVRTAQAAFEYIREERSDAADAVKRLDFYRSLIGELGLETNGPLPEVRRLPGRIKSPSGEHYLLPFGPVEQRLHDGLMAQYRNADLGAALAMFEQAVALAPDSYLAHFFYGNALLHVSSKRAAQELEFVLRQNPESCNASMALAQLHAKLGREDDALKILANIQEHVPEFAPAFAMGAQWHQQAGREEQALMYAERALGANPWYAPAATTAGSLMLARKNPEDARDYFARAAELAPRNFMNRIGLGVAFATLGDNAAAAEQMEQALAIDPKQEDPRAFLLVEIKLDFKNGKLDQAEQRLRRLIEILPNDPDIIYWLARTLERMGRGDEVGNLWQRLRIADISGKFSTITRIRLDEAAVKVKAEAEVVEVEVEEKQKDS